MRLVLILFTCLLLCWSAAAQENKSENPQLPYAILEVKLKSSQFTDFHPECGEDCVPWSFWNRYKAKVTKVLYGEFDNKLIEFVYLQHAGFAKVKNKRAYIVIHKFTNEETLDLLGTPYFVNVIKFPREVACFDTQLIEDVAEDADTGFWGDDYFVTGPTDRCFATDDLVLNELED